eukprot:23450-Rhodomonas_salina.1
MEHRMEAKTFNTWRDHAKDLSEKTRILNRVVRRFTNRVSIMAFASWAHAIGECVRLRRITQKVVCRWVAQARAAAFHRWHDNVLEYVRQKDVMQNVLIRMMNRLLVEVLDTWQSNASESLRITKVSQRVISRWTLQTLAAGFERWRSNVRRIGDLEGNGVQACLRCNPDWHRVIPGGQALDGTDAAEGIRGMEYLSHRAQTAPLRNCQGSPADHEQGCGAIDGPMEVHRGRGETAEGTYSAGAAKMEISPGNIRIG